MASTHRPMPYLEPNMKDRLLNPLRGECLRWESVHQRHILKRLNSDCLPSDAVATLTKIFTAPCLPFAFLLRSASHGRRCLQWPSSVCLSGNRKVEEMSGSSCRGRRESSEGMGRKGFVIIELLLVVGVKSACLCNPVWQRTHLSMPSESDLRLWD